MLSSPAVIKAIAVENYGPHAKTYLEFKGNETLLHGDNDAGKSMLMEALLRTLFNESIPKSSIRLGQKKATIQIEFVDGRIIKREIQGTKTTVTCIDADGNEKVYASYSQSSEAIREFTGFSRVSLDEKEKPVNLNHIPLGSAPFMLDLGPEKFMRMFSTAIAGPGIESAKVKLSTSLGKVLSETQLVTKYRDQAVERQEALAAIKLKKSRRRYEELVELEEQIEVRKATLKELTKMTAKLEALEEVNDLALSYKALRKRLKALPSIDELQKLAIKDAELEKHYNALVSAVKDLKAIRTECEELGDELANLRKKLKAYRCAQCKKVVTIHEGCHEV